RARLEARVAAARGSLEAAAAEAARAEALLEAARGREAQATAALAQVAGPAAADDDDGGRVREAAAATASALADAEQRLAAARAAERGAERDRAGAAARLEALELGLAGRRDGAGALLAAGARQPGVLGAVAGQLHVEPGAEDVVTAALGDLAEAVVVESLDAAVDALRLLRHEAAGSADLVVLPGARTPADRGPGAGGRRAARADAAHDAAAELAAVLRDLEGVDGARPVAALVSADGELGRAVSALLAAHVAVPGLAQARALVAAHPALVAVTESGDVLRAGSARGGGSTGTSRVHVQAAADAAREALEDAQAASASAAAELRTATAVAAAARERRDAALAELASRDAAAAREARRTGELTAAARAASADAARAAQQDERARAAVVVARQKVEALSAELAADQQAAAAAAPAVLGELEDGQAADERGSRTSAELAAASTAARGAEVEARLALRTAEERERASSGRAEGLARAARQERAARERAAQQAERHRAGEAVAAAVRVGAQASLEVLERVLAEAGRVREEASAQREGAAAAVREGRSAVEGLSRELAALTDAAHREEVARVEQRAALDALAARAADELGLDVPALLAEHAPGEDFDRPAQEARLAKAEKALARLGRVNPLALEEYAALEERSAFLTSQLEDLRTTRADLLEIVRTVDERVQQAFAEAFADTAAAFESVFPRLFPGGEGRLVLTDPSDLLTTGVEVEARPAGKRVKRLSLLSGGERSLTAVALLVAIFTARPSPFYVLDEVEAALDDANLRRLLAVLEELRASSQLIVITHQERTMEIADALYGVTMRSDGVTAVVSQRLRERASTSA
ncbi:AAA family ATPase, partial [Quadrisphaera sp. RL12-1S]|uniref:AAA family ATPase n=1 Tax=Quadrisphaera sp. RL12-1S TaxID=2763011 RepID=UPI001647F2DF